MQDDSRPPPPLRASSLSRSTATAKAAARSLSSRAHFARASFLDPSFALPEGTTVVYLYLLDHALEKLRDILQVREMILRFHVCCARSAWYLLLAACSCTLIALLCARGPQPYTAQLALVRGVRIVSNQFHPEFLGRPSGGATEREGRWDLRLFRRPASA